MKTGTKSLLWTVTFSAALGMSVPASATGDEPRSSRTTDSSGPENRAEDATDRLTKKEEDSRMPLPGQGYSHSSLLLDKSKDKEAVEQHLKKLEREDKIKSK